MTTVMASVGPTGSGVPAPGPTGSPVERETAHRATRAALPARPATSTLRDARRDHTATAQAA
jgi:hypothetical protein